MNSISSVRKLQILYFSKKNKKVKNLNNEEKNGPVSAFIHTTVLIWTQTYTEIFKSALVYL